MRYSFFALTNIVLIAMLSASASYGASDIPATEQCRGCDQLRKIETQFRSEDKKTDPDFTRPRDEAVKIILTMPDSRGRLNEAQIDRVVEIFRLSIPRDPGRVILEDLVNVIDDNRAAIEKSLAKKPPTEAKEIRSALEIARPGTPQE